MSLIREVERYARMEYPKIASPLATVRLTPRQTKEDVFLPHVEISRTSGNFIPEAYESLEMALERSNEEVKLSKMSKKVLGKN